jgi:hypothetical protein
MSNLNQNPIENRKQSLLERGVNAIVSRTTNDNGPGIGNQYPIPPGKVDLRDYVEGAIFDVNDGSFELGSVDAVIGMSRLAVTSYKTTVSKLSALNLIAQVTPDVPKVDYQPSVFTFDENGYVNGVSPVQLVTVKALDDLVHQTIGWLLVVRPNNTLIGSSTVEIKCYNDAGQAAFAQRYQVVNQNQGGAIFIFNHDIQMNVTIDRTEDMATGSLDVRFEKTGQNESGSFTVFGGPRGENTAPVLEIKGSNSIVFAYPVFIDLAVKQAFWEHYVADAMTELADTILESAVPVAGLS